MFLWRQEIIGASPDVVSAHLWVLALLCFLPALFLKLFLFPPSLPLLLATSVLTFLLQLLLELVQQLLLVLDQLNLPGSQLVGGEGRERGGEGRERKENVDLIVPFYAQLAFSAGSQIDSWCPSCQSGEVLR